MKTMFTIALASALLALPARARIGETSEQCIAAHAILRTFLHGAGGWLLRHE
ncbi:MAG: hypothetical protein ACOYMN_03525 [Roseimicrobium sp.]